MHEPGGLGHAGSENAGNDTGGGVTEGNALALPVADRGGARLDREMKACLSRFLAPDGPVLRNREATMIAAMQRQTVPASTSNRRSIG
jgi:hypothetical protein